MVSMLILCKNLRWEPSGRRITRVKNTFWYLRTVRNPFMECVLQTLMFVDLYGTAHILNRDSETFHNNSFFTIATAAITRIHAYCTNVPFYKYHQIIFERQQIVYW